MKADPVFMSIASVEMIKCRTEEYLLGGRVMTISGRIIVRNFRFMYSWESVQVAKITIGSEHVGTFYRDVDKYVFHPYIPYKERKKKKPDFRFVDLVRDCVKEIEIFTERDRDTFNIPYV